MSELPSNAPVSDRPLDPTAKRPLYERFVAMGFPAEVLETLVFVIAVDDQELELSRNEVRKEHLDAYVRAYPVLPTWDLRCALAYVLQDQPSEALVGLRIDVLGAPRGASSSLREIAQATSLAWLQGRIEASNDYLDDPELLARESQAWLERHHASRP